MRKLLYIVFILLLPAFNISGQEKAVPEGERSNIALQLQKLKWNMELGTSYTWVKNYGGFMSYYASPGFTMPLKNGFALHGGVLAGVNTAPGVIAGEGGVMNASSSFVSVYSSVSYSLNKNVMFYGTGIKNILNYGSNDPFFYPSYDELRLGSVIRLGEHVTIGGSVSFRNYNDDGNPFAFPGDEGFRW